MKIVFGKLKELISLQREIYDAGYNKAKEEAPAGGYDEGFEAGKQAEYGAFWDAFQQNGNRTNYRRAFVHWLEEPIPRYFVKLSNSAGVEKSNNSSEVFAYLGVKSNITKNDPNDILIDVSHLCSKLDFSECTIVNNLFTNARVRNIDVDLSGCTTITRAFAKGDYGDIDCITVTFSGNNLFDNTFAGTNTLTTIAVRGEIGNSISFSDSVSLSKESITSIINALSSTTSGLSITFSLTAVNKAFSEELFQVVQNTDTSGADIASTKYISKTTSGTIAGMAQIEGGKTYTISRNLSNKAWRYFFFDAEPLDTGALAIGGEYLSASLLEKTITAPTNAKYLVIRAAEGLTEEEMQNFEISVSSLGSTGSEWLTLAGTRSNWTINLV